MKNLSSNQDVKLASIGVIALMTMGLLSSCAHKKQKSDESTAPSMSETDIGSSDTGNALGMNTVRFDFDSMSLTSDAKNVVSKNAQILKSHPNVKVQIEGHCDARGGVQYNIALGERRAKAVEHLLEDLGVQANRLSTISYGKERPIDPGQTEDAYAKNRRANFVITSK